MVTEITALCHQRLRALTINSYITLLKQVTAEIAVFGQRLQPFAVERCLSWTLQDGVYNADR
jgi:hypothetical protein